MNEWEIYFNVKVKPNDEKKYKLSERTELIGLNDLKDFVCDLFALIPVLIFPSLESFLE